MKLLKIFFKHPKVIVAACLAVTGFFGFFIKDLALENSLRSFYPQNDASYARLTDTEETFGSMLSIGITLETTNRTSILTKEYIDIIRKISDRLLDLPEVESIDSLGNIDYVCDDNGSISASPLIPDTYEGTPEDIAQIKSRLTEWNDMYSRVIINDNGTGVQLQVTLVPKSDETLALEEAEAKIAQLKSELKTAENKAEIAEQLKAAKEEYKAARAVIRKIGTDIMRQPQTLAKVKAITYEEVGNAQLDVKFVGEPVLSHESKGYMMSDLVGLIPLVVLVVIISLFLSFKTITGTVLPLCTVIMSTAISCGLMGLLQVTFTLVSSVIPVALIAVGSAYGIHVLTHYYIALKSVEGEMTKEKYDECVFQGLEEVKVAVILAGITTIVGFISLVSSPLGPLHNFAIFSAVGVALSLVLSVTFIPSVLLLKDYRKAVKKEYKIDKLTGKLKAKMEKAKHRLEIAKLNRGGKTEHEASGDTLYSIYRFFCGSLPRMVITSFSIIILSYAGLRALKIDTALINYFPKDCSFRQDVDYVDGQFAGTNSIFFLVEGENKGDITNPELLKVVDEMENYLSSNFDNIGKIVSFTTFIKRINQVWHVPGYQAGGQEASAPAADDSWDSGFGDEDLGWGDFGDFGDAEEAAPAASVPADFVDPNIQYQEWLNLTPTTMDILTLLNRAYIEAGGKYATADKMVEYLLKELNYNGTAYYEIPYDVSKYPVKDMAGLKNVVDNYLILLSGSLERFIDDDMSPKTMRITCQLRSHSSGESGEIIKAAQKFADEHFPEGYKLSATGSAQMEHRMTDMIVSSQIASLLMSLFSVFLIIALSFKSGWAGLIGAIPLAFSILLNYMTMGFFQIRLDFLTSIIASVAVGVGIDYTIHFLSTYRKERSKTDDIVLVARKTFRKSGIAIVTNALAVGLGFLVLCFSKFIILRYIGILIAIVMFTSSFLAMTIIPGILTLTDPNFIRPKKTKTDEENKD